MMIMMMLFGVPFSNYSVMIPWIRFRESKLKRFEHPRALLFWVNFPPPPNQPTSELDLELIPSFPLRPF
jgi:hypothetical protein